MGSMIAGGDQAVTGSQEVGGAQEAEAIQGAIEGLCQLVLEVRLPQWKAAPGMQSRGGQTHPAPCDPGGGSPLRTPAQTPIQK